MSLDQEMLRHLEKLMSLQSVQQESLKVVEKSCNEKLSIFKNTQEESLKIVEEELKESLIAHRNSITNIGQAQAKLNKMLASQQSIIAELSNRASHYEDENHRLSELVLDLSEQLGSLPGLLDE